MEVLLHKAEKPVDFGVFRQSLILLYLDIEQDSGQVHYNIQHYMVYASLP